MSCFTESAIVVGIVLVLLEVRRHFRDVETQEAIDRVHERTRRYDAENLEADQRRRMEH